MLTRGNTCGRSSSLVPMHVHRYSCSSRWWSGCSVVLPRSEEHTSELQSRLHLVCRLLLEKKKQAGYVTTYRLYKESTATNARSCSCYLMLFCHSRSLIIRYLIS